MRECVVDGAVGVAPVDGESQTAPEEFVLLLVLAAGLQAGSDECGAPDVLGGLAGEALDEPLGGQPVVVEAHGVVDIVAVHAPEAGDEVGVAVRVHVTQVKEA